MKKKHLLVWDGIGFAGGSKKATLSWLKTLDPRWVEITVVTKDPHSWQWQPVRCMKLVEVSALANKTQGILFFVKHLLLAANLLLARLRFGKIDMVVGASGPGVDFTLYLARYLFHFILVQLVHGPVACSRSIGRSLAQADTVCYLASAKASIQQALQRYGGKARIPDDDDRFLVFSNGLPAADWPKACQQQVPRLFWAASLLKWKGLELFIRALQLVESDRHPHTHICYIRPRQINLLVSDAPVTIPGVQWHEMPPQLDDIRADCNIFVSTSHQEPFGLSILEAMAAGHCILIPADGAYWDQVLENGKNCIKYRTGDATDLADKIHLLLADNALRIRLGNTACKLAKQYRAEKCYRPISAKVYQSLGISNHHSGRSESDRMGREEYGNR